MIDVKEIVEELVGKIKGDKSLADRFVKDPANAVKNLLGAELPKDKLKAVIEGIKAKVSFDKLGSLLDSDGDGKPDLGAIEKLLGKKN